MITALVGTSPIPSHPETSIIEETVRSITSRTDCQIVVMADGVRPEQEHLRDQYEVYLENLFKLCRYWDALLFTSETWLHQGALTRKTFARFHDFFEPIFLFAEHDTPLVGDIPFPALEAVIQDGVVDVIRFYHETVLQTEHEPLLTGHFEGEVPLWLTRQWSQRPHLASTRFYWKMLEKWFPLTSRTMIEDRVHGPAQSETWGEWKIGIYAPEGNMQRSIHLNGRGDEPKFDMIFE